MQRSNADTWNHARFVGATAAFVVESTPKVAEV
jgi:hypothetical protein